jgi:hypothetical protein
MEKYQDFGFGNFEWNFYKTDIHLLEKNDESGQKVLWFSRNFQFFPNLPTTFNRCLFNKISFSTQVKTRPTYFHVVASLPTKYCPFLLKLSVG